MRSDQVTSSSMEPRRKGTNGYRCNLVLICPRGSKTRKGLSNGVIDAPGL